MLLILLLATTLLLKLIVLENGTNTYETHGLIKWNRVLRSLKADKVIVVRSGSGHILQLLNCQGHQSLFIVIIIRRLYSIKQWYDWGRMEERVSEYEDISFSQHTWT